MKGVLSRVIPIVLGVFLMSSNVLAQEEFTHQATGIKFTLPAGWSYEQSGDHFEASSPDESVVLLFFAGKHSETEAAMQEAANILDLIMSDAAVTKEATHEKVNNLDQVYLEGTGNVEGETIDWDLTMVYGGSSSLAVVALGDIDGMQDTINHIYGSIHK
ncbi:MAG: hypothetical protein H6510_08455 [Acidobacteria bacterium]|nr:hypothetical protein [Acidobacteriota bacterium]MCB9397832.1 hypothetical protein [Acidobacteriota bacterium]